MHFLICTMVKTQASQDHDDMMRAELLPWSLHTAGAQRDAPDLCIHLTSYFLWRYGKCTLCVSWWEVGRTDRLHRVWFLLYFCFGTSFRIYVSFGRGKGWDEWRQSQKQMNGVKGDEHEALCLRLGHFHINAIQMICYKKVYLHRYDRLKLKKEKVNITKRNQTD